jgi:predicted outer membrane repeat protein
MKTLRRGWRLSSIWRLALAGLLAAALANISAAPRVGAAAADRAPLAPAATIGVTNFNDPFPAGCASGTNCSLREAIFLANITPAADTILLPAGTYTLTRSGADDTDTSGDLDVLHDITFQVQPGPGGITATIRADGAVGDRIFHVLGAGTTVTMTHLAIQEGHSPDVTDGGGMLVGVGASARLISTTVENNSSGRWGGGIANLGQLSLVDSLVRNNTSRNVLALSGPAGQLPRQPAAPSLLPAGGGIYAGNNAGVVLQHTDVISNQVLSGASGGGLALVSGAVLTATDSLISHNASSNSGGGLVAAVAVVYMANTTISSNTVPGAGGGIYTDDAMTLVDSLVKGNVAASTVQAASRPSSTQPGQPSASLTTGGGGIYALGTTAVVVLQNTDVIGNQAQNDTASGGGVSVGARASLSILGGQISGNTAGDLGGAVHTSLTTLVISNAVIYSNTATSGGGLGAAGGSTLLDGVQVIGNHAASGGGGIALGSSAGPAGAARMTITSSVVASNTAAAVGGGISASASFTITNSTLSGNTADMGGGGVFFSGGGLGQDSMTLDHATISGNSSADGGGVLTEGNSGLVRSTIVAGNLDTSGGETPDCSGTVPSGDYNLFGSDCATSGPITHTLLNTPAQLGPLQNNGGATLGGQLTHALLVGSPALSAADPAHCPAADQRGEPRALGGPCDIGAFEAFDTKLFLPVVLR